MRPTRPPSRHEGRSSLERNARKPSSLSARELLGAASSPNRGWVGGSWAPGQRRGGGTGSLWRWRSTAATWRARGSPPWEGWWSGERWGEGQRWPPERPALTKRSCLPSAAAAERCGGTRRAGRGRSGRPRTNSPPRPGFGWTARGRAFSSSRRPSRPCVPPSRGLRQTCAPGRWLAMPEGVGPLRKSWTASGRASRGGTTAMPWWSALESTWKRMGEGRAPRRRMSTPSRSPRCPPGGREQRPGARGAARPGCFPVRGAR